jgi:hypothetical protein
MKESSSIDDLTDVLVAPLTWEVDPDDVGWLRAGFDGRYLYLRINNFPDQNLYSLWLGRGRYLELEDMPANWRRQGPLEWPRSARPPSHLTDN